MENRFRSRFEKPVNPVYLYLGFAFYLLAFVALSFYAYEQFSSSSQTLSETIRANDTQSNAAMRMRVAVRERAIILWQMSIEQDPFERDELYLKFREYGGTYQRYRAEFLQTLPDENEEMLMELLDQETRMRAPMLREFSEALMSDSPRSEFTLQLNQALSNQIAVANILDKLIYMQTEHNQQAHEDNKKRTSVYFYQLIFLGSFILVTGSLFAWIIVSSFMKQRHALLEANNELHEVARSDNLTGLPNRMSLMEHMELNFSVAVRHRRLGALLFIDLDGFKEINDNYGHDVGDRFLQHIAIQMTSLRDSDLVARLGGDEFVVVLLDIESRESAETVAEKLLIKLSSNFLIDGYQLSASASIGIAFFPEDNGSVDAVLSSADAAMYEAKKRGKNQYSIGARV